VSHNTLFIFQFTNSAKGLCATHLCSVQLIN